MQIASSTQNTHTVTPTTALSKTNPTVPIDTITQETESINKNSYKYIDLGENLSQYQEIDSVQEQTNKDIVNYLTGFMNSTSAEGKKNLHALDTLSYGGALFNMTEEEYQKLETHFMSQTYEPYKLHEPVSRLDAERRYMVTGIDGEYIDGMNLAEMKEFLGEDYAKNAVLDLESIIEETGIFMIRFNERQKKYPHEMREPYRLPTLESTGVTKVIDAHRLVSLDEANKLSLERFQNLYSFSDEFTKTDKFKELYDIYNVKLGEKMDEIRNPYKRIYETVDSKEYISSEVVKHAFSKSEAINYYATVSNELTDMLSWRGLDDATNVVSEIKDSIKLYDKIAEGLKDMWGFGDLDISA
ncbi:MAG: hypothetical protein ACI9TV_001077 [Sulfurimonas sp.]|jgi:hypothetical protein|uniref:hypothetical protein n=1 Tax=Sulfurimonas sp. TaxID=2022749 RepID=UPI0039E261F4